MGLSLGFFGHPPPLLPPKGPLFWRRHRWRLAFSRHYGSEHRTGGRIAAASLAISIVFYAVVLVIFGLKAGSGGLTFPVDIGLTTRLALVGGFALVFVMLWFFLYVQNIREAGR